jgi:large subunit ribosomal protein L29
MNANEVRNLSDSELRQKIQDIDQERFNLRFQSRTGKLDNPLRLRWLRRDAARCKTVLGERALGAKASPAAAGGEKAEKTEKGS